MCLVTPNSDCGQPHASSLRAAAGLGAVGAFLKRSGKRCLAPLVFGFLLAIPALPASGCSLPVFRYALDRWTADTFQLLVSPSDAEAPEVAKFLRNFGTDSDLNLEVKRGAGGGSKLLSPDAAHAGTPLWEGRVNEQIIARLLDSPGRAELVRRLVGGDSVVWVLVESGDPSRDEPFAKALEKRLRYLQQVVALPPTDPNDLSSRLGPGPELRVRFSILRIAGWNGGAQVSRESAGAPHEESFLVPFLAGVKSGLAKERGPWAAAVFGRGRVLGAWPAADLGDEQIEEVTLFLAGACSCQVKRQNPGWDLLLKVDWLERLREAAKSAPSEGAGALPMAEPASVGKAAVESNPAPETVHIQPEPPPESARHPETSGRHVAAFIAVLCVMAAVFQWRRLLKR